MSSRKARGFTLIELLIVTVVIVTLMGIVFRLAGTGTDAKARGVTVARLQRLENALSGYYAAFGCYPPVPLHGYRSIYLEVNDCGIQTTREKKFALTESGAQDQIQAACRSQPVAACFPYNSRVDHYFSDIAKVLAKRKGGRKTSLLGKGFDGLETNPGRFQGVEGSDWQDLQIFKFGLLSYLLPRYLFMLQGSKEYYDDKKIGRQWRNNNSLPARMDTGAQFSSWEEVQKLIGMGEDYYNSGGTHDAVLVSNILTQAVCARWMQNFEHIVRGGMTFYGVDTRDPNRPSYLVEDLDEFEIYAVGEADNYPSQQPYVLDGMTVDDGWNHQFYYYSPPPYQTYQIWSAGPDGCTFPPWIDLATLNETDRKIAARWLSDDIVHLSN